MTVDAEPFRRSKKRIDCSKTHVVRVRCEKKHYIQHNKQDKKENNRSVIKKKWEPSENLLSYNRKKLVCYIGSRKMKQSIPRMNNNKSMKSSSSMVNIKVEGPLNTINHENNAKYKNESKGATKRRPIDFTNRNKESDVLKTYRLQIAEYQKNKLNGLQSSIIFS